MAKYWVGGTGNWSDTTHWSASSGGAGSDGVPGTTDDVIFDSLSNATAYTVTVDTASNCRDLTMAGPLVGAVTWAGSSALNIYGSMSLSGTAGITRTYTGGITFLATSSKTITTNTVTLANVIVFDGIGSTYTFQDDFSNGASVTHNHGTLDTNGKTINLTGGSGNFTSSNSNTRTLTLGASLINCVQWSTTTTTNLTFNSNTSTITSTSTFQGGGLTFYNVIISSTAAPTLSGANTFNNLTRNGVTNKTSSLTLNADQTITGTLTITGNSTINRLLIQSNIKGTTRTLTAGTVSITNADFQDITGAGAGSWDLSVITGLSGDCGGNSGITFTTPVTTNWQSGATWSTATWSSRVPLPQDTAIFTTAGTVTITQDMPRIGSVDFSTVSGTKTWTTSTACSVFGSINLTNLTTLTASTQTYTFEGRGSNTLTSAGKVWAKSIIINIVTGTLGLGDLLSYGTNTLTVSSGTFDTNNNNILGGGISISSSSTRTVNLGSSTIELTGNGADIWGALTTTGLTFNAGTSTIKITSVLTGNRGFSGGSLTYNNFWNNTTGAFAIIIRGNNIFNDFKIDAGRLMQFTTATTQRVTTFTANGTAGNEITINSTTTGTHSLVKDGGGTITCDYLNIQHSIATPGLTWLATNSTNNQATATAGSGWYFDVFPEGNSNFFMLF